MVQTKTHSLISFQTKQKSEESKQGEQSKWLLSKHKITNNEFLQKQTNKKTK